LPVPPIRLPGSGALLAVDASPSALASAIYLWLPRGAAAEREDEQGLAHLLEHMLFKGAGGHGVSEAAARIEGLGGDLNAFTSYEQTVLHATVPAGREALAIALLCEMAFSPRLDPEELEREKGVVVEEIRGAADDPTDLLAERLRARLHRGHPYGRPILGTEATVRALTAEGMRRFHRAHHRPSQAMLVVAGPVDLAEIQAAAAAAFAAADPGEELPPPPRAEARPQHGAFVLRGFEERTVELAWAIPGLRHPDLAALDLLSSALGDGDTAILTRRLRDELGLAVDAWAALESEQDRGVLVVGAHARPGKTAACARALMEEVARVAREGLPVAALRRARRGILTSRIWERETVDGRAARLAWYLASFGDAAEEQRYEARIQAVRAEELRQVAARWLRPEEVVAGAVVSGRELSAAKLAEAVRLEPVLAPIPDPRPPPAFVRRVLSCGAVVVIEPDPNAEVAALSLVGVGGSLLESARTAGLSSAWSALVTRGAGELDAATLAAEIEDRAGSLRAWRARNSLGLELRLPEAAMGEGIELLGEILLRPTFPQDELDRALDDLDEAREGLLHDDPGGLAWTLAWEALYPGHPWGRSSLGTERSVRRITRAGLRAFHRRCLVGGNLVLGVAGAVEPDEVVARLERVLRRLPAGPPVPASPPAVAEAFVRRRRRRSAREQAHLVMAFPPSATATRAPPPSACWRACSAARAGASSCGCARSAASPTTSAPAPRRAWAAAPCCSAPPSTPGAGSRPGPPSTRPWPSCASSPWARRSWSASRPGSSTAPSSACSGPPIGPATSPPPSATAPAPSAGGPTWSAPGRSRRASFKPSPASCCAPTAGSRSRSYRSAPAARGARRERREGQVRAGPAPGPLDAGRAAAGPARSPRLQPAPGGDQRPHLQEVPGDRPLGPRSPPARGPHRARPRLGAPGRAPHRRAPPRPARAAQEEGRRPGRPGGPLPAQGPARG
jgi:zinc protease